MTTYYWLREGDDDLEQAERFRSKRAAVDAYAAAARELAGYGQPHTATIHIAETLDDADEYPDYVLELGPRGGVRCGRT